MSTIDKKPFLKELIESLTEQQIVKLKSFMDGGLREEPVLKRTTNPNTIGDRTKITAADKGVHRCNLEHYFSTFNGYLIYNDDYCVLIWFTDFQNINWFSIDVAHNTLYPISEALTIVEMRSELDDTSKSEKAEIIATVNKAIEDGDIVAGTEVEANPTLAGTEAELTGIKIGDAKYKAGGEQKYLHTILLSNATYNLRIRFQYVDNINKIYNFVLSSDRQELGLHLKNDLNIDVLYKDCIFPLDVFQNYENGVLTIATSNRNEATFSGMAYHGDYQHPEFKNVWATKTAINLSDGTSTNASVQGSTLYFDFDKNSCIPL